MPRPRKRAVAPSGTVVIAVRLGARAAERLDRLATEYDTTAGRLARFILANTRSQDVKRMLFAQLSRIDDDDRDDPPTETPDQPEPTEENGTH